MKRFRCFRPPLTDSSELPPPESPVICCKSVLRLASRSGGLGRKSPATLAGCLFDLNASASRSIFLPSSGNDRRVLHPGQRRQADTADCSNSPGTEEPQVGVTHGSISAEDERFTSSVLGRYSGDPPTTRGGQHVEDVAERHQKRDRRLDLISWVRVVSAVGFEQALLFKGGDAGQSGCPAAAPLSIIVRFVARRFQAVAGKGM